MRKITPILAAINNSLFPMRNLNQRYVFGSTGTIGVVAAQQILDTFRSNKLIHHTHFGVLIHALNSHLFNVSGFSCCRRRRRAGHRPVAL
jgi:hypothetical protein